MKKLLSLLSVLTISGTAAPTTIAASCYQKEETKLEKSKINSQTNILKNLSRNKRDSGTSDCESNYYSSYCSFSPELWEEITIIMNKNIGKNYHFSYNHQVLSNLISEKMNEFNVKGLQTSYVIETIIFSFDILNNEWQKSDKKHYIRIVNDNNHCMASFDTCLPRTHFESVNIRTDWDVKNNKYLSRIENDLTVFNLEIIDNDNNETILNAIKNKNPNLDISQIEIANKKDYSHFSKGFSVKVRVKNGGEKYSNGIMKNDFIFNTKVNIDKINNIIKNDSKVNTWINHLKDWKKDLDNELKTSVLQKTDNEKIEWKNRKKEDLKTYIRYWSYIINLIEDDLQLKELNNTIQSVKNDIFILKNSVKKLEEIIVSFANSSNLNLANIATVLAGISPAIPVIGTFGSCFLTIVAGLSAIAGV